MSPLDPLALAILGPLSAALLILVLYRVPRISPTVLALLGVGGGLIASLSLLADAFQGINHAMLLPGLPDLPLRLLADPLSALLSAMVAVIASLVTVYAVGYMHDDPEPVRFFATLLAFVTAMQLLVLAGDWLLLLAAWELIGLSSYLLIGFWYQRPGVPSAASRAFLYTRSADLGLYIAVFILIAANGSSEIAATLDTGGDAALAAGLLLLLAAMGKSAQAPLYDWLQRAMAGPTPVSALLHSATLVAAGAILLIRSTPLMPPEALLAIGIIGGVTSVITGLIALGESDLKRLLAASTSSQYGLMLVAIGAGVPLAALLHLIAHAAIKSSLFLGAGVFQHSRDSTQFADLDGVGRDRPRVFIGFVIAALALSGIPPLSGFFSKEAVIAAALSSPQAWLLGPLALAGTLLTGAYMARALRRLWRDPGQNQRKDATRAKPIAGLGWMGAGVAGLVTIAATLGLVFPAIESQFDLPLPVTVAMQLAGLGAALSGLALGWFIGGRRLLGPLLPWAQQGFAIAGGMDNWVLRPAMAVAHACNRLEQTLYQGVLALGRLGMAIGRGARISDERGIDALIFALVRGSQSLGTWLRGLQSGLIHREMAITVAGTAAILITLILVQL